MFPDDGCEGDFSILFYSWPMMFALYFKLGFKVSLLAQTVYWTLVMSAIGLCRGERQGKVRTEAAVVSMIPLRWYGSLPEMFFLFLSVRQKGLDQLLGTTSQLVLGNFFYNRERWRTPELHELFLYSIPTPSGSWAVLSVHYARMILRRSMRRGKTAFVHEMFPHLAWGGKALESEGTATQLIQEDGMEGK